MAPDLEPGPLGKFPASGFAAAASGCVAPAPGDHVPPNPLGSSERTAPPSWVMSGEQIGPRWHEGERLNHLLEKVCRQFEANEAIVTDETVLTYRDLDNRANQVARYLIDQGIKPGDRVALLFDRSAETYIALLAVMKVNAAYVPLDPGFPTERIGFILTDANVKAVVSMSGLIAQLPALNVPRLLLDTAKPAIDTKSDRPLGESEAGAAVDQVCYIIYTSGTTGTPKGVVIAHASICNFVRVAAERYGFAPGDRVYQGMTIAFDFSVEEIWVPLMAGATLVPGTPGMTLLGDELADFLRDRRVQVPRCCLAPVAALATA